MRRVMIAAGLFALVPGAAWAHITVAPREAKPGVEEHYTVRVPTEGQVATTSVFLEVLEGHGGHQASPSTGEVAAIEKWLAEYDAAFNAKDLEKLGTFYHPDVTIYEGGGVDNGWAAYRDGHLGPELKAFEDLQFGHRDITVSILPGGQSAYVRSEYFLKAKMATREIDSSGLATYVLIKGADGWKIRHSHTSSRPRRPAGG